MFAFFVTVIGLALALVLAALANAKIRGLAIYRSLLLWPYGIAPAIAGILWLFIFHPSYGVLPYVLSFVTAYQFNWFLKGWVAMTLIVVAAIWKQFGYNLAFYLAGLQAIPRPRCWRRPAWTAPGPSVAFSPSRFPLLSPVTFFLFTLNMTFAFFDTFGLVHSVTQGGPGDATSILVYKAWKDGFENLQLGISAAQSVVLMVRRHRADRVPVPLRREEGQLLMARVLERTAPMGVAVTTPRRRRDWSVVHRPRHPDRLGGRARLPAVLRVRDQHTDGRARPRACRRGCCPRRPCSRTMPRRGTGRRWAGCSSTAR